MKILVPPTTAPTKVDDIKGFGTVGSRIQNGGITLKVKSKGSNNWSLVIIIFNSYTYAALES